MKNTSDKTISKPAVELCICDAPFNSGTEAALDFVINCAKPFKISASKKGIKISRTF